MPTYEYECQKCSHHFEKLQGINDRSESRCPSCGGPTRRLISAGAGIIVKGRASSRAAEMKERCSSEGPCCGSETVCRSPHCME